MAEDVFTFSEGQTPLLISVPHAGTEVAPEVAAHLMPAAKGLPDTDWHVDRLYDFAKGLGAGMLVARQSRYVVDLNRDPEGKVLYAGADNTEVCPLTTFDLEPVHRAGKVPDAAEVARRIDAYWRPYHRRLEGELAALKGCFGIAVLFDAHSIRSQVPRFFEGVLPHLNLGTHSGKSASAKLRHRLERVLASETAFSHVVDGRFTGGYITRHYGDPEANVHAVQLEMAQRSYMDEAPPCAWRPDLAERVRPVLIRLVEEMLDWAQSGASPPSGP